MGEEVRKWARRGVWGEGGNAHSDHQILDNPSSQGTRPEIKTRSKAAVGGITDRKTFLAHARISGLGNKRCASVAVHIRRGE